MLSPTPITSREFITEGDATTPPAVRRGKGNPLAEALRAMRPGDSVTYVRPLKIGDMRARVAIGRMVGSAASRALSGARFTYESFTAITTRANPIVGVILRRVQ